MIAALVRRNTVRVSSLADLFTDALLQVQAIIKRTKRKWEVQHQEIVKCKYWLCKDAAMLAGLRLGKKVESGKKRDNVLIGAGVPIFDLRDLHGSCTCGIVCYCIAKLSIVAAEPDKLSASLTHVVYLLHRTSSYLGIRLPAEITLPHRDYPLPTILKPDQSYRSRDVPFPGQTPTHSSFNSPNGSRVFDTRPTPHPRPLFIQKDLQKLAKEDPNTFSLFIEGVTLLAWNVAWLCKSQGMGGFTSWIDVCPMGRNLYLLFDPESRRARRERLSSGSNNTEALKESGISADRNSPSLFGQLSHGTAHSFLGAAEAAEPLSSWRLQNTHRIWDKVRTHLITEMQKAEWEVVQQWDDEELAGEEPVLVGGRKWTLAGGRLTVSKGPGESGAKPAKQSRAQDNGASAVQAKGQSANGWTKLRPNPTTTNTPP